MRWVAVTADGYEYEGDLDEVKELMAEVTVEKDEEGIELGNEGDGDGLRKADFNFAIYLY